MHFRQPVCRRRPSDCHGSQGRESGHWHVELDSPGYKPSDDILLSGADVVHTRGFYVGLPSTQELSTAQAIKLRDCILSFRFEAQHIVLVTGSNGLAGAGLYRLLTKQRHQKNRFIVTPMPSLPNLREERKGGSWLGGRAYIYIYTYI